MTGLAELFVRYRDRGDLAALAEVFDRTAPRLLSLALHLCREPSDAEDVLQATFVAAIRKARSFDGARPLEPWLSGILAGEARNVARRENARRSAEPHETPDDGDDPHATAERREMVEQLRRHADALPEEQRQVVLLQLAHGLTPAEIAEVLGVKPGTVRMRLHRALATLRRVLPAGLAALAAARLPGQGLAHVRRAVLAEARREVATASTATAAIAVGAGVIGMKKVLIAAVAVPLVLVVALVVGPRVGSDAPSTGDATPSEVVAASGVTEAPSDVETPSASNSPTPPPSQGSAPRTAVPATSGVVRGRCVDEHGRPLAGVTVALDGRPYDRIGLAHHTLDHGEVRWTDPDDVVTGADGRFEHRFDPPPPYEFVITAKASGRVSVRGTLRDVADGSTHDVGDLVLGLGVVMTGAVVDVEANPVVGAYVRADPANRQTITSGHPPTDFRACEDGSAYTQARGRFSLSPPLRPGAYVVEVTGYDVVEPNGPFELVLPTTEVLIAVTPKTHDESTISGVVVDPNGLPIRGASVTLTDALAERAYSDRDGDFRIRRSENTPAGPVALQATARGFGDWRSDSHVAWGTADLRIVLPPGPSLTIRARSANDGSPVERFGIVLNPVRDGRRSTSDLDVDHLGDHPGGDLTIPRISPGAYRVSVLPPESSGFGRSAEQEVEVRLEVPEVIDVPIHAIRERVVEIVSSSGRPVPGAHVELLETLHGEEVSFHTMAMDAVNANMNADLPVAVLHDDRTTDADGRVRLRGTGGLQYALRLPGPGHVPHIEQPFGFDDSTPARIVVGTGATLRGRITPAGLFDALREEAGLSAHESIEDAPLERLPRLTLYDGSREFPAGATSRHGVPIGADGSFEIVGVPPGTWFVTLTYPLAQRGVEQRSRRIAADIELEDGKTRTLDVDLSAWVRRSVEFVVTLDGESLVSDLAIEARLPQAGPRPRLEHRRLETDGSGTLTVGLEPASWEPRLVANYGDEHVWLPGPTFDVLPGEGTQQIRIDFRTGSTSVVVLSPGGEPVDGVELELMDVDRNKSVFHTPRTDDTGRAILRGLPGPVRIVTRREPLQSELEYRKWCRDLQPNTPEQRERALVDLGTVELVPGGNQEITLRLPPEWHEMPD